VIPTARYLIVCFLLIAAALFIYLHADVAVPVKQPFSTFPVQVSSWRMTSQTEFSADVLGVLKPSDYIYRQYKNDAGATASLYIGYHGGGKDSGGIHSPKHCLPGSGWFEVSTKRQSLDVAGTKLNLVQAVYQKGDSRELFIYWFQVRDTTMNEEYSLKMSEIINSLLYQRRDSAFIRISVPFENDRQAALTTGEGFVRDFVPVIRGFLPL